MRVMACLVIGYFMGTVNPSYIIGRMRGMDIRTEGSGNAGASNAIIMMGKAVGALCALFDIFKAYAAYRVCTLLFPSLEPAGVLAGAGCMLGHIFPVWMGFRGGKGLACLGGTILAYDWKFFFLILCAEILLVLAVGYICVVAISASVVFPVVYAIGGGEAAGIIALAALAVVIFFKHRENIRRIIEGRELRISYLWNKDGELDRIGANQDKK